MADKKKPGPDLTVVADNGERIDKPTKRNTTKRGPDGLTIKQRAFCHAMLDGTAKSQSDAYRQAYDVKRMSDKAVAREGYALMINPYVSQYLKAAYAKREQSALVTGASVRGEMQKKLMGWAGVIPMPDGEPELSEAGQLRAMDMLGKLSAVAAFSDRVEVTKVEAMDDSQLQTELETKLKAAFNQ